MRERHDGIGLGFPCPKGDSEEAFVDYVTDDEGVLTALLLECVACGEVWTESSKTWTELR